MGDDRDEKKIKNLYNVVRFVCRVWVKKTNVNGDADDDDDENPINIHLRMEV